MSTKYYRYQKSDMISLTIRAERFDKLETFLPEFYRLIPHTAKKTPQRVLRCRSVPKSEIPLYSAVSLYVEKVSFSW